MNTLAERNKYRAAARTPPRSSPPRTRSGPSMISSSSALSITATSGSKCGLSEEDRDSSEDCRQLKP